MKFLATFILATGLLAATQGAAMRLVDPRGQFGTRLFPSVLMDARAQKIRLFKAFAQHRRVGGLFVGSSRSWKLDPEAWQALLHEPFFNFGVEYARTEDYLAIYRWVRRQGHAPRYLVIGLDVDALDDRDSDPRLLKNEPLRRVHRPDARGVARPVHAGRLGRCPGLYVSTVL